MTEQPFPGEQSVPFSAGAVLVHGMNRPNREGKAATYWRLVPAPREASALPLAESVEVFVMTAAEAADAWDALSYDKKAQHGGGIRRADVEQYNGKWTTITGA